MRTHTLLALMATGSLACAQYPAAWTTLGNNGLILGDMATGSAEMHSSVMQPDGKLIIAGEGYDSGLNSYYGTLVRIDTVCGALDSAFGDNGETTVTFEQRTRLRGLALQPDGRIIGCGMIAPDNFASTQWPGVFRLHADGSVDTSFNHTGYVRMQLSGNPGDFITPFATDSTITCLGVSSNGAFAAVRFLTNGTIDTSFADNGYSYQYLPSWALHYENAGIQLASGAYLAAVIWCDPNVSDCYSFALAKYLNNGQPDTTFGNNGIAITGIAGRAGNALGLAELPDGRILIGGNANGALMVRLLADGSVDPDYGTNGSSIVPDQGQNKGSRLVVLADGSTLQFGRPDVIGACILRDADGHVVNAFGTNGVLPLGGYAMTAGHLLPSGRIIAMGWDFGANTNYALAGLTPDPVADGLPVITMDGADLVSSGTGAFQWYLDGGELVGETGPTLTPVQNGSYTVSLTRSEDCVFTSAPYQLLNVGVQEMAGHGITLFGNPVEDYLQVRNSGAPAAFTLISTDGRRFAQGLIAPGINTIAVGALAPGAYLLAWETSSGMRYARVLKR